MTIIISKFTLTTNDIGDVCSYCIYLDCIRDVQQSETKKAKVESNKDESSMIIVILNGLQR